MKLRVESMKETVKNHQLFSVPVYERFFPKFDEHKVGILKYLASERGKDAGVVRSNQRGWHSRSNLHLCKNKDVNWLVRRIYRVAGDCIKHNAGKELEEELHMVSAWFNVNEPGTWNAPHTHMPQDWSGVFYIDIEDDTPIKKQAIQDGDLVLFDPLPIGEKSGRPPTVGIKPKSGLMVLFPSYLIHMVAPHSGERERISFAFNFKLMPAPSETFSE